MSGYTCKTEVHALHERQEIQEYAECTLQIRQGEYDASTAKSNDSDRKNLAKKTIDHNNNRSGSDVT